MKIVLYTEDMEPITIIEIPLRCYHWKYPCFTVAVQEPLKLMPSDYLVTVETFRTVDIKIETFRKGGKTYPFFFVSERDLISAFDLKSTHLPGQRQEWDKRYRDGFIKGLTAALMANMQRDE